MEEADIRESSICETTPLRLEEEIESKDASKSKSGTVLDSKSIIEENKLSPTRTEPGDISSPKSNVTKSEDTDNTVIHKPSSSSQVPKGNGSSPTQLSESKESEKTGHSRQESIKQAKARFLESDI